MRKYSTKIIYKLDNCFFFDEESQLINFFTRIILKIENYKREWIGSFYGRGKMAEGETVGREFENIYIYIFEKAKVNVRQILKKSVHLLNITTWK